MRKILALLLTTSSVMAIADGLNSTNLYIGAGAGAAWNDVQSPAATFRLDGGYNWTDNWAVELGDTLITQSGGGNNQSMSYYDLSIKGTIATSQVLSLFAQIGGAYGDPGAIGTYQPAGTNISALQGGWNFLTAAGLQFSLTRQVSLNLTDYYYYGAPTPQGNTDVLLGGVKYNF